MTHSAFCPASAGLHKSTALHKMGCSLLAFCLLFALLVSCNDVSEKAATRLPADAKKPEVQKNDDGSTITMTKLEGSGTLAVHKDKDGNETKRVETKSDKSTITTTPTKDGGTLVVNKDASDTETKRVETKSDKSTITTTPTKDGGTLVVNKDASDTETKRVETKKDKSSITTTPDGKKALIIHSSVSAIGKDAYKDKQLTSVSIPASLGGSIDQTAFAGNSTLKRLTITGKGPIKDNAFTYEHSRWGALGIFDAFALSEIASAGIALVIGNGITSIGKKAFAGSVLTSVVIPTR